MAWAGDDTVCQAAVRVEARDARHFVPERLDGGAYRILGGVLQ